MAKYYGKVGYAITKESTDPTKPGVWKEEIIERHYYGDVRRNSRRLVTNSDINDDVVVSNEISIVSDPFANENFHAIRYAEFMGVLWKVTNVDVAYPRITLTLGGVYNAE